MEGAVVNIQIIGTRKNSDTRAAERFFRDRGIAYQFVDLNQRGLSAGELSNIVAALGTEDLIDPASKSYKKRGLAYMEFDPLEEIGEDPSLMRQPVVREGRRASVGVQEDVWMQWISDGKVP